ncbi:MAG TPA: right-handed parallel beta-helix repeat-containing protein [Clostridiales bacterium]|nr:right-handed parallel beta-helix repeat-containing protein [Clostridiales bacterium]
MAFSGNCYYIDLKGDDANIGTSPDAPFRSFAPLKNIKLGPNDKVFLKRGCTWNEELFLEGQGTPDGFIEVTAYGEGDRPKIQRSGHISERCIRINNASYFKMSSIEVCNAGAGIVLFYDHSYHNKSVYLDDIVAHDFFGIYRASGESSSIEEWKSYRSPDRVGFSLGICVTGNDSTPYNDECVLSDFRVTNTTIYKTGGGIGLDWCDHRCCDGSMANHNKFQDVLFENLHLYDNDVPDVSLTSMFLQCVTNAIVKNVVIDKGAGGAPWGTAAIHLQLAKNVHLENVTILNMPHTGVSDQCGIDFEADVDNCSIINCTFMNNAGAAIEFLANFDCSPDAVSRNILIKGCKFFNNNYMKMYTNPSQILVQNWQKDNRPTGWIVDCEYLNPEEVVFLGGDGFTDGFVTHNNTEITRDIYEENAYHLQLPSRSRA